MLKTFEVDWKGTKETIEFEDDLPWGIISGILKECSDFTKITEPQLKPDLYERRILENAIKKAPFNPKNYTEVGLIPLSTYQAIANGVLQAYPLERSFGSTLTILFGEQKGLIESQMKSTPFVP